MKEAIRAAIEALEKLEAALVTAWGAGELPALVISGELVREYRSALSLLREAGGGGEEPDSSPEELQALAETSSFDLAREVLRLRAAMKEGK